MIHDTVSLHGSRWRRRFFTIWTGQAFSLLGSTVVQFALIWWLTVTTGSATVLTIATLMAVLPQVLLSALVGTLIDRWDRRLTIIASHSLIALCTLSLASLFASEAVEIWQVYILLMLRSLGENFHKPAMQASTTLMVPEKHYARVAGINQALNGGVRIVGAPLGALLLNNLSMSDILLIDVVMALLAVVPLLFFSVPQPPKRTQAYQQMHRSLWAEFSEGLRYVWTWRGLALVLGLAMLLNFLLTPASSLLPLLVAQHFQAEAEGLAAMNTAAGIGTIIGGMLLGAWGGFRRRILTSLVGMAGVGMGILLVGIAPSSLLWLAVTGMLTAGMMIPIANAPIHALVQASAAPAMQGRIFGLMNNLAIGITPLSLIAAGPVAEAIGVQSWFTAAGIGCLAAAAYGASNQTLMGLESLGAAKPEPGPKSAE